jgi:hypothetical protein
MLSDMYPRDFSKQLRRRLAEGQTLDDALKELRSAGASIMECIKATKHVRGCDVEEAKRLIHDSTAWADVTARTDSMWAEFAEDLDRSAEPGAAPDGSLAKPSGGSDGPAEDRER